MKSDHLKEELKKGVLTRMDMTKDIVDQEILSIIDEVILEKGREEFLPLHVKVKLRNDIFNSIRRLDVLQDLLENDTISEIMINGYNRIFVEQNGEIHQWDQGFASKEKLEDVIQQIVSGANRIVNETSPIVDARLADGSRVNVVLQPIAIDGAAMTIRKFPKDALEMDNLIRLGTISQEAADDLRLFVRSGYNIFISGGTSSGKTTVLNALSGYIPIDQRVITIEDSAELKLIGIDNLIRLEVRNANVEGSNQICIRDLIKSSLRMRPDKIIIGEIRGEEALDMLQALNTGHSGFSTGHANSSRDMLSRIETMTLIGMDMPLDAIRAQIASAIDIIIHVGRIRDKSRKVLEITEVLSYENSQIQLNSLYEFKEDGQTGDKVDGRLRRSNLLRNRTKLQLAGYEEEYLKESETIGDNG